MGTKAGIARARGGSHRLESDDSMYARCRCLVICEADTAMLKMVCSNECPASTRSSRSFASGHTGSERVLHASAGCTLLRCTSRG